MDETWHNDADGLFHFRNHGIRPGLSLLKKLERAKLRELYDAVDSQEYEQRFHGNAKSRFLQFGKYWEWQADDGSWQLFEPDEQWKLESAVEMRQKTVPFMNSIHFMHTADLTQMLLVNMKTGRGKRIRRTPEIFNTGQLLKGKGDLCKRGSSIPETPGWKFTDTSGDEGLFADDTCNCSGINFLGSATLDHLACGRTSRVPSWSRHGRSRDESFGSFSNEVPSFRTHGSKETVSRQPHEKWRSRGKRAPVQRQQSNSLAPHSAKRTCDETNKLLNWLKRIGLEDYYDKFKRERITLKEVRTLCEKDLKKLGLPMGARKRFTENARDLKVKREPPNEYLCPITMNLMTEPVLLSDGFTYEKSAIEKWLSKHNKSPMTNGVLESNVLIPNRQLKKLIEDFKELEG